MCVFVWVAGVCGSCCNWLLTKQLSKRFRDLRQFRLNTSYLYANMERVGERGEERTLEG